MLNLKRQSNKRGIESRGIKLLVEGLMVLTLKLQCLYVNKWFRYYWNNEFIIFPFKFICNPYSTISSLTCDIDFGLKIQTQRQEDIPCF